MRSRYLYLSVVLGLVPLVVAHASPAAAASAVASLGVSVMVVAHCATGEAAAGGLGPAGARCTGAASARIETHAEPVPGVPAPPASQPTPSREAAPAVVVTTVNF